MPSPFRIPPYWFVKRSEVDGLASDLAADEDSELHAAIGSIGGGASPETVAAMRALTDPTLKENLDTAYVPQALTGVWIGSQRYATLADAIVAANSAGGGRIKFLGDIAPSASGLPAITSNHVQIHGGGPGKSILRPASGATEVLRVGDKTAGSAINGIELANFRLTGAAGVTKILNLIGMQMSLLSDLRVDGASDVGAIGILFDTQSVGSFIGSINNTMLGGYINSCYNGLKLTRDAAKTTAVGLGTSADDGCNHNTFFGTRGASFTGIGFDVDHGENVKGFGIDFSTGNNGATGIRINDDVCLLSSPRADNSFGAGNTGIGIRLTANARDHYITNPTGNGPTTRMLYDDPTITGQVIRQSFTVQVGNVRRSQAATGSDFWLARAWKNAGGSTISAAEVAYFDSTMTEGDVKRLSSTATATNPMVAVESITAGSTGAFAEPGSVVSVKVDAGAVAIGDLLVGSTTVNGAAKVDNTATNPRLIIGRARTSLAAGNSGSTVKAHIR